MSEIKEIGEAVYEVTHLFNGAQNKSDIIKNRVLEKSDCIRNLTGDNPPLYNNKGGSVHSEEVL